MTAALEGGEWSAARPGRTLLSGKARYPFYRGLGGPQGRSGRAENLVPTGTRFRTVQPVVSRYTDWTSQSTYNIGTMCELKFVACHCSLVCLTYKTSMCDEQRTTIFPSSYLSTPNRNVLLTAVLWTLIGGFRITANGNSGKRFAAWHHAKYSEGKKMRVSRQP